MKVAIRVKMKPASEIIQDLGLEKGGAAHNYLCNEVLRISVPYVPLSSGRLRASGQVRDGKIVYDAPYARKVWAANWKPVGKRGPQWVTRAWLDNRDTVLANLQKFIGGRI